MTPVRGGEEVNQDLKVPLDLQAHPDLEMEQRYVIIFFNVNIEVKKLTRKFNYH